MALYAAALSELEQAASRNGYPADPLEKGDWLLLRSPWTRHELLATCDGSAFVVASRSSAVAAEAAREFATWSGVLPPNAVRAFSVAGSAALHALIDRLYRLALSLPPEPLLDFEEQVAGLPRETEAERLVAQRIGQDVFRKSLIDYWGGGAQLPELTSQSSCVPATSRRGPIARPMPSALMSSTAFCSLLISTPPSTRL